jgi:Family of unknown function (DUF5684)
LFRHSDFPLPNVAGLVRFGPSAAFQTSNINKRIERMEQHSSSGIGGLIGGLIGLLVAVGIYVFVCYCLKLICVKAGHEPGVLIWIPIVQIVPLLTVAKLPIWFIILLLIPLVGFVVSVIMWVKICQARGKSG